MLKKNISIQYNDIHPTEETRHFVYEVVQEIQNEMPKGSVVKATYTRRDHVVKAILQVSSSGGPFFAVSASNSIREATLNLLEQMRKRMEKWKSKRHEKKGLKTLFQNSGFLSDSDSSEAV